MNWKNCFRLLIPTLGITAATMVSPGCASDEAAPFHMYDSPLLEGRVEARYPRSRDFDPMKLGDHTQPTKAYADSGTRDAGDRAAKAAPSAPVAQKTAQKPAPKASDEQPPALSTRKPALSTREQAPPQERSGAPANKEASARADERPQESAPRPARTDHTADYVWSVYALNGVEFSQEARSSVATLFRECKERGKIYHSSRPDIGDVVFFHNTGDANGDGRNNDWYTHAAIVESHGDAGQVSLLGYRGGGVERFVMNLESPDAAKTRRGEVANTQLRPKRDGDAPFTQYLAGQLFAGSCSVLGERSQMVVIDNWKPGMELN